VLNTGAAANAPAREVTAPAVTSKVPQPPSVSTVVTQAKGTANHVLPDGLLKMDDRAVILVSGKPTTVAEIKREFAEEMKRLSGLPKSARSTSRTTGVAMQQTMKYPRGPIKPNFPAATVAPSLSPRIQAGVVPGITATVGDLRREGLTDPKKYCRTHAPAITGVRGALTPNQRLTIEGVCFGTGAGEVQVIGQFVGGNMRLVVERWSDGEIVASVPAVRGAPDHGVAVTVVRADKTRTPAAQTNFVAARERIEVPGHHWDPNESFSHTDVAEGGGNILTGYIAHGHAGSSSTPFTLSINKACGLDNVVGTSTIGRIDGFSGWEDGPPYEAKVSVIWTPRCITRTANYVFATNSQRVCSVEFNLKAWAICPVGVAP
jgi:hypothetical protein